MPQISVIIPTHNGTTRFLDQALDSVFAQTCSDWELIIVDDASTDETVAYVQDHLQNRNHPVKYLTRSVNGGPSAARNDGARVAKGVFLAFLDQDDLWHPTFLEDTMRRLFDTPEHVGAIHTDQWTINAEGRQIKYVPTYRPRLRYSQITPILCRGNLCYIQGMLLKRHAFECLNGFDEALRTGEDREFFIRLHQQFRVEHIPTPLYSYRVRYGVSAHKSTAPLAIQIDNQIYRLQKHAHLCESDPGLRHAFAAELGQLYYYRGKAALKKRDRQMARHYFKAALLMHRSPKNLARYVQTYLSVF